MDIHKLRLHLDTQGMRRGVSARRATCEASGAWLSAAQMCAIAELVKAHVPTRYVAAQYLVSDERVRQICRAQGLDMRAIRRARSEAMRARIQAARGQSKAVGR